MVRSMTYSIVARDPLTGELGVAVQSHWFSVGSVVSWAQPGVGAVATQANAEVSYGPQALELLAAGRSPQEALDELIAADPGSDGRQVAVLAADGRVAAHTGSLAVAFAGHVTGDGFSCQANIMANDTVWPAMKQAFETAEGPLAERLMVTLEAAEAAGGDIRGRQSAAILVVPAEGEPWRTTVSLRVEDDPEPLVEMRRLLAIHGAYAIATEGDDAVNEGRFDDAARLFGEAHALVPDSHELLFWSGLGRAQGGDVEGGAEQVRAAIELQPGWGTLLERLPADVAPSAAAVREALARPV
jgi:uncharacterized Ntn-hydrolase superfamily protein